MSGAAGSYAAACHRGLHRCWWTGRAAIGERPTRARPGRREHDRGVRAEHPRHHSSPPGGDAAVPRARVRADRRKHFSGRTFARAAFLPAAGTRLGLLPHPDRQPLYVRLGHAPRRRDHGRARAHRQPGDSQGLAENLRRQAPGQVRSGAARAHADQKEAWRPEQSHASSPGGASRPHTPSPTAPARSPPHRLPLPLHSLSQHSRVPAQSLLESPFALLGEPERMADALRERQERLDLSWIGIPFSDVERFYADVATLLA